MIKKIWNDSRGGVITTELVLVASMTTATLLAGLTTLRSKVDAEFAQLANSLEKATQVDDIHSKAQSSKTGPPRNNEASFDSEFGVQIAGEIDTFVMPSHVDER